MNKTKRNLLESALSKAAELNEQRAKIQTILENQGENASDVTIATKLLLDKALHKLNGWERIYQKIILSSQI